MMNMFATVNILISVISLVLLALLLVDNVYLSFAANKKASCNIL